MAACSGTIDTPSEENPPARAGNDDDDDAEPEAIEDDDATANDDDDDGPAPTPPASTDDDEEDPPAPPANTDDEEDEALPEDPPAPSGGVSFASDVWPIFNASCGPCHVASSLGNQSIGSEDLELALDDAVRIEDAVLSDLETGRMPPSGCGGPPGSSDGCITEDEFATIEAWYEAGAPE